MKMHLPLPTLPLVLLTMCASTLQAGVEWEMIDSASNSRLPPPPETGEPTATLVADVDGDGDADLIIGQRYEGPAVILWRYEDGAWSQEIIDPEPSRIEAGGAVYDIDGDGDLDITFGGDAGSGDMWWWENPHPKKGAWNRYLVKRDGFRKHHDSIFGDFDGDGKTELVAWNQFVRVLMRLEIPENPRTNEPWPITNIFHWEGNPQCEGLAKADVDGDGVDDIIGGGYWFRHEENGKFSSHFVDPDPAIRFTRAVAGQLVKGGRPEIVFAPGDADGPVHWYEWNGESWDKHVLLENIIHGHNLDIGDINGDGHLDIMTGEMGQWSKEVNNPEAKVMVHFGNSKGEFKSQLVNKGQGVHESRLADVDGDGDLDIFSKPFRHNTPKIVVWLNNGS